MFLDKLIKNRLLCLLIGTIIVLSLINLFLYKYVKHENALVASGISRFEKFLTQNKNNFELIKEYQKRPSSSDFQAGIFFEEIARDSLKNTASLAKIDPSKEINKQEGVSEKVVSISLKDITLKELVAFMALIEQRAQSAYVKNLIIRQNSSDKNLVDAQLQFSFLSF